MKKFQIVIPMSGFGERFRRAGYNLPKPLIEVEGKPIIAHVIDMFPGESDFLFICNEDHLNNPNYNMRDILLRYCPEGRIVGIPSHKLGPIHAVRQVEKHIDPERPVVVNYCDFTCYWDWKHFKNYVSQINCDGAIPAYKGFHPHTLGTTNYAYMKEKSGWVLDIQEKQPFTDNRMEEYASSGTYYFATGLMMINAFADTMEHGINVGGEYYVSLAYKSLFAAKHSVAVYPLQHFMQWGTPEDVDEYNGWSQAFRHLASSNSSGKTIYDGTLVIPMAGLGQRFSREGYTETKPLIPVSGKPMVVQAVNDLPASKRHIFILRNDMNRYREIMETLQSTYSGVSIIDIPQVTEGQACTALIGVDVLEHDADEDSTLITFGACDNGAIYDDAKFKLLADDLDIDVIVWGARAHANAVRYPEMFGWIDQKDGIVHRISVKQPLDSPATDPIVIGTFTFRRADDFRRVVKRLIDRDGRVNGEFYIDSCINDAIALGLRCHFFEVDSFISWGTPNDLRTFEYWQSCFHKWQSHPYQLELDSNIPKAQLSSLKECYRTLVPDIPKAFHG